MHPKSKLCSRLFSAQSQSLPDFHSTSFLRNHIQTILSFYDGSVDSSGGFYQNFLDDGTIFDRDTRHLVSSARFVLNYSWASQLFQRPDDQSRIKHGLRYLEERHFRDGPGYTWLLKGNEDIDKTNHCYGLSFLVAAGSNAMIAGVEEGHKTVEKVWDIMEEKYWESDHGAYKDEANEDFSVFSSYRGQNANMHAVEAMLWAFEATGERRYLDKASTITQTITGRLAEKAGGVVWEHFKENWEVDWKYNFDDPKHLFRPWGINAGHLMEWSKLLLILERHSPENWQVERAERFFNLAYEICWDDLHGGFLYSFSPERVIFDSDKYYWVHAEGLCAAKLLQERTSKQKYSDIYEKIWEYSWQHMIDHQHGGWYRLLTRDNQAYDNQKSPCGKVDYHSIGACFELVRTLERW